MVTACSFRNRSGSDAAPSNAIAPSAFRAPQSVGGGEEALGGDGEGGALSGDGEGEALGGSMFEGLSGELASSSLRGLQVQEGQVAGGGCRWRPSHLAADRPVTAITSASMHRVHRTQTESYPPKLAAATPCASLCPLVEPDPATGEPAITWNQQRARRCTPPWPALPGGAEGPFLCEWAGVHS